MGGFSSSAKAKKQSKAIDQQLRQVNLQPWYQSNVLIVGLSGSGKTTLTTNGNKTAERGRTIRLRGSRFEFHELPEKSMSSWRVINRMIHDSVGLIFLFDISDLENETKTKEAINSWTTLRDGCPCEFVAVVWNKIDLLKLKDDETRDQKISYAKSLFGLPMGGSRGNEVDFACNSKDEESINSLLRFLDPPPPPCTMLALFSGRSEENAQLTVKDLDEEP